MVFCVYEFVVIVFLKTNFIFIIAFHLRVICFSKIAFSWKQLRRQLTFRKRICKIRLCPALQKENGSSNICLVSKGRF